MTKKIVTVNVIVVGGSSLSKSSLSGSSSKAMKFVDRALGRAKAACSYASSLSNSHHRHLSTISKKFAARSLKVNRGSSSSKPKQQLQQQASSLLLESFQVLPQAVGMAVASGSGGGGEGDSYEAVLNRGLLPIAYSARPLPRCFVRRAAAAAAVSEAAKKKKHLKDDTTTMMMWPSETKKENLKNVVCGENVKNYLDALCSQLAKEMNALEKTVRDNFVTKYVEAKLRTEGAMSKQQRLQTYGMCMYSNEVAGGDGAATEAGGRHSRCGCSFDQRGATYLTIS